MSLALTAAQRELRDEVRAFVDREIAPHAGTWDRDEHLPAGLVRQLGEHGYFAAALPIEWHGSGLDFLSVGLLTEELGGGCTSVRSLVTVQGLVGRTLCRWGTVAQRQAWVPALAAGTQLAAFALTEPEAGSDAAAVQTSATRQGNSFVLRGCKTWITGAQLADVFLVIARCDNRPTAFLVERGRPGLLIEPVNGLLGARASMLGVVRLQDCEIPAENLVGRIGTGLSHVASYGLDYGRFSVAWGCVGLAQACLDASLRYATQRRQFGVPIAEHQLIQRMISRAVANVHAARLLCSEAARLAQLRDPALSWPPPWPNISRQRPRFRRPRTRFRSMAGRAVVRSTRWPVLRDAHVMEIIEGSTQIQEIAIARFAFHAYAAQPGGRVDRAGSNASSGTSTIRSGRDPARGRGGDPAAGCRRPDQGS